MYTLRHGCPSHVSLEKVSLQNNDFTIKLRKWRIASQYNTNSLLCSRARFVHASKLCAQTCASAPHHARAHHHTLRKRTGILCSIMHLTHDFCLFCLFKIVFSLAFCMRNHGNTVSFEALRIQHNMCSISADVSVCNSTRKMVCIVSLFNTPMVHRVS